MEQVQVDKTLQEQIEYYRARAGEYDEWFYRKGRYDYGPLLNQQWFDEAQHVMATLHALGPVDSALELACGTGIWTEQLLKIAQQITAIDAAPEVIAINREKLKAENVGYVQADLFQWEPDQQYDLVFFSFWLSHVPAEQLDVFLAKAARATRPGGGLFIVDSRRSPTSTAQDHATYELENPRHIRKLNDGRAFEIYKIFYEPDDLRAKLAVHGFEAEVQTTANYFIYAHAIRR
jgi:demethylmenaquinone methyltransferase/2-methoxy-6-polyprenyl-1,4-benzoquinol methylase